MTRYGMNESDMQEIAVLFRKLLIDGQDVSDIRRKVLEMRSSFQTVKYTFPLEKDIVPTILALG